MNLWNRFLCWRKGHKRGKLVTSVFDASIERQVLVYSCPRCGRRTVYRVKVKP